MPFNYFQKKAGMRPGFGRDVLAEIIKDRRDHASGVNPTDAAPAVDLVNSGGPQTTIGFDHGHPVTAGFEKSPWESQEQYLLRVKLLQQQAEEMAYGNRFGDDETTYMKDGSVITRDRYGRRHR